LVSSKKRRLENQSSLQKKNILCLSYWKVFDQKQEEEEEEEEDEHGFGEARLRWCVFFLFRSSLFFCRRRRRRENEWIQTREVDATYHR